MGRYVILLRHFSAEKRHRALQHYIFPHKLINISQKAQLKGFGFKNANKIPKKRLEPSVQLTVHTQKTVVLSFLLHECKQRLASPHKIIF